MRYLLDTNILLRLSQPHDPIYQSIVDCLAILQQQPDNEFCFFLQNISEFWNTCTRPKANNGYGFNVVDTDNRVSAIESFCVYLPDMQLVYSEWRRIVVQHNVSGIQVHDAKLVAGMSAYGITYILTLNQRDFLRYSSSGIISIAPDEVKQNHTAPNQ